MKVKKHIKITYQSKSYFFPKKQAQIFTYLIENENKFISKDELIEEFWANKKISIKLVEANLSKIRKILGEDRVLIKTINKKGYKLINRGWS